MSTGQVAITASASTLLAAGVLAAFWRGVFVLTVSFRVVPPWSRKAPEKRVTTTNSAEAAAGSEAPAASAVPIKAAS